MGRNTRKSDQGEVIKAHIEFRNWTFTPWSGTPDPNVTDASHGHWYYNGDEFDGIFKGRGETSTDPKQKYRIDEQFRLNVEDNDDHPAIWAHHLERVEDEKRLQWLSYGIKNGNTQTKIN